MKPCEQEALWNANAHHTFKHTDLSLVKEIDAYVTGIYISKWK